MVKVSVIIPVYNDEDYVEEALDGILNQTLKDIEVICVNDGSTDDSLRILEEIAERDDRVSVFSQENKGGGAARNYGMKFAKGKYLYFMDADDIIKENTLERTYNVAEEKSLDFLIFKAINYDEDTDKYYESEGYSMNVLADFVKDDVFNFDDLDEKIFCISVTPWCKLYNREFVIKSKAQFAEGLIFHDNIFFWGILFEAKRIYFLNECLYIRRRHSKSSTGSKDKRFLNIIPITNMIWDIFKQFNVFDRFKGKLYNKKVNVFMFRYLEIQKEYKELYFKEMKKDFSSIDDKTYLYPRTLENYEFVLESDTHKELDLLLQKRNLNDKNEELAKKNKKLENENKKLKDKNKKLKKERKELLSSNSWKLTKPIRNIGRKLK